jgi:hypothetical protein
VLTGVGVEKADFSENRLEMGDQKYIGRRRESYSSGAGWPRGVDSSRSPRDYGMGDEFQQWKNP